MYGRLVLVFCAILAAAGVFSPSADARYRRQYDRQHHRHHHNHRYHRSYDEYGGRLIVISEQDVDLSLDKFTIDVRQAKGAYKGIRIRNAQGRLFDIRRVQVVYADGTTHNEDRQIDMYRGERSRPINPTEDSRFIDQLNITQEPQESGRGRLQIIGIQDDEGRHMERGEERGSSRRRNDDYDRPSSRNSTEVPVKPTVPEPTTTAPGRTTAGGDVLFGAQYVGFLTDRDVIRVGNEVGKFSKIRLRVLDNDIHINEMKVIYANGESDTLAVNADIPKNSRTNWIDLRGDRFIKEIQLQYKSRPSFSGQARIEVFGKYAAGWLGPGGEGRKYNQGWVLLGAQTAGFVGFDKDIIPVGSNEGGFRRIRVTARDRAITLNEVKVVYVDGAEDIFPVRQRVDAGQSYGPIELKGERRQAIDHIEAKYRSRFFDSSARGKGAAIVEVWAQHY